MTLHRIFATVFLLLAFALPVSADEAIVKFASDVSVNSDASLNVIEAITVLSDGSTIRHGIFRDFPTRYKDRNGLAVSVAFVAQSVSRDGASEPFTVESISNGVRVKIGDKDVLLDQGLHQYVIVYQTKRQLGFFEDHDEIYWNVTGNGWNYPIRNASIKIHLPQAAVIKENAIYTGSYGASGKDAKVITASGHEFEANTTRELDPYEGFTVAVAWQKGIVAPPTKSELQLQMVVDNAGYGALFATILAVFGYFIYAWKKVGVDPPTGTIVPLFTPPENFDAASVRYVWKRSFDDKALAAILVGLAVKGRLKIENDGSTFVLTRLNKEGQPLLATERGTFDLLPTTRLELGRKYSSAIMPIKTGLRKALQSQHDTVMFLRNLGWLTMGVVLAIVGLGISVFLIRDTLATTAIVFSIFVSVWWTIIIAAGWSNIKYLFLSETWFGRIKSIAALIFIVPFAGAGLVLIYVFTQSEDFSLPLLLYIFGFILIGLLCLLFAYLLPAPTVSGRKVLDQIEGFRMYMTTAEEKRLNTLNPPEKTPELFERYLPFAMALDCENAWNDKFAAVLAEAAAAGATLGAGWYYGSHNSFGNFSNNLGNSLVSTLAVASTPPSTSSGSSGGGFSGGGGGGGGGGGW